MELAKKKNEVDMLHGSLAPRILAVALPLAAISIMQQLFNAADVAVVGRFAGAGALAAVGACTPIVNMFITFFGGLATGGNVAISTMIGRGDERSIRKAVSTVITLSFICAIFVSTFGQLIVKPLLSVLQTPAEVFDKSVLYLRIYLCAMFFAVVYNWGFAILRSKGDTKRPMYCLICSGVLNVLLNLVFVIVFKMDVAGVALATFIANIFCAVATLIILNRENDALKVTRKSIGLDPGMLKFILRIGLPAGIQGMLFSVSNMVIQAGVNSFGPDCIAGNTAAMNFEFFSYFIVNAFGQTATTFTSQNYGAGKYKRVKKIFWLALWMGAALSLVLSLIFFFGQSMWLGLFTTEASVLAFSAIRMMYVVLPECLTAFNEIPSCVLRGMGVSLPPTIIAIMGSFFFRIFWVKVIFAMSPTINMLMLVYPVTWMLINICMMTMYFVMRKKRLKGESDD